MIKKLFVALILVCSIPLLAQDTSRADLSKLTKEQQIEVLGQVEAKAKANAPGMQQVSTPEQISKWVGLGKEVAELIPVFAEKTGIAADKVLNSFSGKVLLSIVLVHFFWGKAVGLLVLIIGIPLWWRWFRNMFLLGEYTQAVHPNPILAWFGCTKTLKTYKPLRGLLDGRGYEVSDLDTVWLFVSIAVLVVILASGLLGIFV